MARAHPVPLRERVVAAYEAGVGSFARVAERFTVGEASVKRWVRQFREEGTVQPRRRCGGTPSQISEREIRAILGQWPDAHAGEITAEYNRNRRGRARLHVSSIKRALHRFGYVIKKNGYARSNSSARTSKRSARRSLRKYV